MTRPFALGGVVGPAAFISAWSLLGAGEPGYSPTRDAISRLAAVGTPTRPLMTAAFVALGGGAPLYGLALRSAHAGPAWVAAVGTGLFTLGAAAFPVGSGSPVVETLHQVFPAPAMPAWQRFLCSLPVERAVAVEPSRQGPQWRRGPPGCWRRLRWRPAS